MSMEDELASLRAEIREIVGDLRVIHRILAAGYRRDAREKLWDLIQRFAAGGDIPNPEPNTQQTAIAALKSQGFRFTNWIPAKPDANAITRQHCAVMVRKTKSASEYCQVHPDGSIIDGSII